MGRASRGSAARSCVRPTTGTSLTQVSHILTTYGRRALFSTTRTLSGAKVKAPGAVMTGALRLKAAGRLTRRAFSHCKHGILSRPVRVGGGAITAKFDSIATTVFDTNLNHGFGAAPMIHRLTS